ncbi:hypothetical protein [Pseudomonas sp. M30-35]|uniref:hypothetical protein n=1 Tax=Pseudomonas sp. M30-35 TaxID=1981174 RepID=UPI000B3BFB0B|nr:hypothetical protein [Pseudomonas sp. M30-35]ARU88263.1 hypothetical protein B9K09_09950 [Pseudomonas sp. M30-35]
MLAKLLAKLTSERALKYFSLSLLVVLIGFMAVMEYRQHQAMLASYCERLHAGQDSNWRVQLGYQCPEVTP